MRARGGSIVRPSPPPRRPPPLPADPGRPRRGSRAEPGRAGGGSGPAPPAALPYKGPRGAGPGEPRRRVCVELELKKSIFILLLLFLKALKIPLRSAEEFNFFINLFLPFKFPRFARKRDRLPQRLRRL